MQSIFKHEIRHIWCQHSEVCFWGRRKFSQNFARFCLDVWQVLVRRPQNVLKCSTKMSLCPQGRKKVLLEVLFVSVIHRVLTLKNCLNTPIVITCLKVVTIHSRNNNNWITLRGIDRQMIWRTDGRKRAKSKRRRVDWFDWPLEYSWVENLGWNYKCINTLHIYEWVMHNCPHLTWN